MSQNKELGILKAFTWMKGATQVQPHTLTPCGVGFKSKQKVADYSHNAHAAIVPVGISCWGQSLLFWCMVLKVGGWVSLLITFIS